MNVIACEQRSPEWHAARVGLLTASCAGDMMATIKSGEAAARRDLRVRLVVERLTGVSQEDAYVNPAMQRGIEKEADAFAAYEALTGRIAFPVGFLAHDTLRAGCSPDGIVGEIADGQLVGGGLELKCPKSATHLAFLKGKTLPKEYVYQIVHSLWITGAAWWDFVSFDDRFPAALQVFHVRVERNQADLDAYELMARSFLAEIDRECDEVAKLAGLVAA